MRKASVRPENVTQEPLVAQERIGCLHRKTRVRTARKLSPGDRMRPAVLLVLHCALCIGAQDIYFERPHVSTSGRCITHRGQKGTCIPITECDIRIDPFNHPVICGWKRHIIPIICCSKPTKITRTKDEQVQPPRNLPECGVSQPSPFTLGPPDQLLTTLSDPYRINAIIDKAKREGETVRSVVTNDRGMVTYAVVGNSTLETAVLPPRLVPFVIGGADAEPVVASYMALLGESRRDSSLDWYCDGVLINERWVLTAAHCLEYRTPSVVRIGEYDYEDPFDRGVLDREVDHHRLYPDYVSSEAYHDLALLRLRYPVPLASMTHVLPVCLPWGKETNRDLVGATLILSGWGALRFGGSGSPVLQQVNLTVFPSERCQRSFSRLNLISEFPRGITEETSLCAGSIEGGRDACQGDSGGPVVYENSEQKFVLAGIVSKGYGCGDKDYPGIYVPINKAPYLKWLKEVAF